MRAKSCALVLVSIGCGSAPAPVANATSGQVVTVRGVAQSHGSYCGGAPPTKEILEEVSRPRPVAGKFLVRAGAENTGDTPVAELSTAADGSFTVALPPGDYCVVTAGKRTLHVKPDAHHDRACLERVARTCDATWHVTAAGLDGAIDLNQACFGECFNGPPPP